jgi:hypothetical protein
MPLDVLMMYVVIPVIMTPMYMVIPVRGQEYNNGRGQRGIHKRM